MSISVRNSLSQFLLVLESKCKNDLITISNHFGLLTKTITNYVAKLLYLLIIIIYLFSFILPYLFKLGTYVHTIHIFKTNIHYFNALAAMCDAIRAQAT